MAKLDLQKFNNLKEYSIRNNAFIHCAKNN